jgi:hypothetical protein
MEASTNPVGSSVLAVGVDQLGDLYILFHNGVFLSLEISYNIYLFNHVVRRAIEDVGAAPAPTSSIAPRLVRLFARRRTNVWQDFHATPKVIRRRRVA